MFIAVFMVVWLCAVAYAGGVVMLALRVRQLKKQGQALQAPDILHAPVEMMRGVGWLLTNRYASLGDAVATRWSGVARVLFLLALPAMLAFLVLVGLGVITPA